MCIYDYASMCVCFGCALSDASLQNNLHVVLCIQTALTGMHPTAWTS